MELPSVAFTPDDVTLFREVLELSSHAIPAAYRTSEVKARLAQRILLCAATGERDRTRLSLAALDDFDYQPSRLPHERHRAA